MDKVILIIVTFLISVAIAMPLGYFIRRRIAEAKIQ